MNFIKEIFTTLFVSIGLISPAPVVNEIPVQAPVVEQQIGNDGSEQHVEVVEEKTELELLKEKVAELEAKNKVKETKKKKEFTTKPTAKTPVKVVRKPVVKNVAVDPVVVPDPVIETITLDEIINNVASIQSFYEKKAKAIDNSNVVSIRKKITSLSKEIKKLEDDVSELSGEYDFLAQGKAFKKQVKRQEKVNDLNLEIMSLRSKKSRELNSLLHKELSYLKKLEQLDIARDSDTREYLSSIIDKYDKDYIDMPDKYKDLPTFTEQLKISDGFFGL